MDRLALAMRIAQRSRRIAVQSVMVGMGLSLAAMAIAAVGLLPPAPGALLQEGIDIAVILNALRALRGEGDRAHGFQSSEAPPAHRPAGPRPCRRETPVTPDGPAS